MRSYIVRLAKEEDIFALSEVERVAAQRFLPYLEQLEISSELLEGLTPLRFLRRAQTERRLWVAVFTDKSIDESTDGSIDRPRPFPVGFIVAKFLPKSCFIVELSVHPDHGRRGIGSSLVAACCRGAEARDTQWLTLTTFRYVPWNIPFYQGLGFKVLTAEQWSPEIQAIVQHEDRYGFLTQHRVVMARPSVVKTTEGRIAENKMLEEKMPEEKMPEEKVLEEKAAEK